MGFPELRHFTTHLHTSYTRCKWGLEEKVPFLHILISDTKPHMNTTLPHNYAPGIKLNIPIPHRVYALRISDALGDEYGKWNYITFATNAQFKTHYDVSILKRQCASLLVSFVCLFFLKKWILEQSTHHPSPGNCRQ